MRYPLLLATLALALTTLPACVPTLRPLQEPSSINEEKKSVKGPSGYIAFTGAFDIAVCHLAICMVAQ